MGNQLGKMGMGVEDRAGMGWPVDRVLPPRQTVESVHISGHIAIGRPAAAQVKIRNKHTAAPAMLYGTDDAARVEGRFEQPQREVLGGTDALRESVAE